MGVTGDWEGLLETPPSRHRDDEVDILDDVFHDDRLPHRVYVDSMTEQTLDEFRDRGVDLMIREVEMNHTETTAPGMDDSKYRNPWYSRESPDIVMFDFDNMVVAGYEVKSFFPGELAIKKLRRWGDDVMAVAERYDLDDELSLTGHDVDKSHINGEYRSPDWHPKGVYATPEGKQKAQEPRINAFLDELYGGRIDLEEVMFV
ncbi:MAG: hypothetical protein ABEI58_04000 [Candidatus Nanohaloarchaea archaeon]